MSSLLYFHCRSPKSFRSSRRRRKWKEKGKVTFASSCMPIRGEHVSSFLCSVLSLDDLKVRVRVRSVCDALWQTKKYYSIDINRTFTKESLPEVVSREVWVILLYSFLYDAHFYVEPQVETPNSSPRTLPFENPITRRLTYEDKKLLYPKVHYTFCRQRLKIFTT